MPGHDKAAAGQGRHVGGGLKVRSRAVDDEILCIDGGAVVVETAGANSRVVRVVTHRAAISEGHDKAAAVERGDRGVGLEACRRGVDQKLVADRIAERVINLAPDRRVARIATRCTEVLPDNDEAAIGQYRHLRNVLIGGRGAVDEELVAPEGRCGGGHEALLRLGLSAS